MARVMLCGLEGVTHDHDSEHSTKMRECHCIVVFFDCRLSSVENSFHLGDPDQNDGGRGFEFVKK